MIIVGIIKTSIENDNPLPTPFVCIKAETVTPKEMAFVKVKIIIIGTPMIEKLKTHIISNSKKSCFI